MIDEPTIEEAFRKVSSAGDQLVQDPKNQNGWVAYGMFHHSAERDECVIVYVNSDGTFEPHVGRTYKADLEQLTAAHNRALAFAKTLELKQVSNAC